MFTKGLSVTIYRYPEAECTNQGVTCLDRCKDNMFPNCALLVGEGVSGPTSVEDAMKKKYPILVLQLKNGYISAVPANNSHISWMFGGNFIHSSDSRFPHKYPIPVHDRQE